MAGQADFAEKLDLVLKALSMSRGRLAHAAQVDKSLVSRWVAGHALPSAHNLERLTAALATRVPGFTMLDWEQSREHFIRRVGAESVIAQKSDKLAVMRAPNALLFPFGIVEVAQAETAKRGIEYEGLYLIYRSSFGRPGKYVRAGVLIRLTDGLLEYHEGARGVEHCGWALLMLNRLYCMLAEEKFESMQFTITNAGQQPRASCISAITLGVSEGTLTPKAAPAVLIRHADVTADRDADFRAYAAIRDADPFIDASDLPAIVRPYLTRDFGPRAFAEGGSLQVTAPFLSATGD